LILTGPKPVLNVIARVKDSQGGFAVKNIKINLQNVNAVPVFANDITNPMVAAFQKVMEISNTKVTLVQFAFYGGYFTIALMFYPTGQICIPKRKTKLKYITGVPYGITTMLSVFLLPAFVIFFKETEPQPKLL